MKVMEIVFERQVYTSKSDGTIQTVVSRDKLRSLLGQSLSMRVQFIGFRMTANAEVVLKAWESSYPGLRPSELKAGNGSAFWTGSAITTLRPAAQDVAGPYGGDVEITMDVRTTTGGTMAEVASVSMTCKPEGLAPVAATWHRMLPSSFDWESEDEIGRNQLPAATGVAFTRLLWSQVIGSSGATWSFDIDSDPILLLTDGRLEWAYAS